MKYAGAAVVVLALFLCFSVLSPALAQTVSCPVGGFSLELPDSLTEQPLSAEDPDLCLRWEGGGLSVQAYASYLGEVAGSDLFQILDGTETESGTVSFGGMNMIFASGTDFSVAYRMYSWMDRGNNVILYFYYPEGDTSGPAAAEAVMETISFDAGH